MRRNEQERPQLHRQVSLGCDQETGSGRDEGATAGAAEGGGGGGGGGLGATGHEEEDLRGTCRKACELKLSKLNSI